MGAILCTSFDDQTTHGKSFEFKIEYMIFVLSSSTTKVYRAPVQEVSVGSEGGGGGCYVCI